jgi:hypothetical protein
MFGIQHWILLNLLQYPCKKGASVNLHAKIVKNSLVVKKKKLDVLLDI